VRPQAREAAAQVKEVRQKRANPILRAEMQSLTGEAMAQSLVNYAAAPIGAKKYDSSWLASNTAAH